MRILVSITAFMFLLTSCANLNPVSTSSNDLNLKSELTSNLSPENLSVIVTEVVRDLKWGSIYSGDKKPSLEQLPDNLSNANILSAKNFESIAWEKALAGGGRPYKYIQVRTPTSLSSFGAFIYIVIFNKNEGTTSIGIAASTSQIVEKENLDGYIKLLSEKINLKK